MPNDIISKKTRYEFREHFVSRTLREIEMEFDSADIPLDEDYHPACTGQRRSLVEKYYHSIDWSKWSSVRKVLTVYENALSILEGQKEKINFLGTNEWAETAFQQLKKWIEKDRFRYSNGRLTSLGSNQPLQGIIDTTASFDAPELHRQIDRMQKAAEDDPELAIGTAKELIETTCKTILEERGIPFGDRDDLPILMKETRKALGLIPEKIPNSAKGAEIIKRLLNNLGNIAQTLAELRNLYGTGHGKAGKTRGLSPRHARLAVGAASTISMFFFDSHLEKKI
ncbi:MAG: abortive infection family protein [Candidatus Aminicenantales bacterium]